MPKISKESIWFSPDGDLSQPEISNESNDKDAHPVHFDVDNPPTDPQEFLSFLKWYHGEERWKTEQLVGNDLPMVYDYSQITSEMIPSVIKWATERGEDIKELNPAQILLVFESNGVDYVKKYEETLSMRIESLNQNQRQLEFILAPQSNLLIHATPTLESVQNIMGQGLYCWKEGLGGSAISLDKVIKQIKYEDIKKSIRAVVIENNIRKLADSHRGHRYQVILELPDLNQEQKQDYKSKKGKGEGIDATSYFVKPLPEGEIFGAEGVGRVYEAVLAPQFIRGYIDLEAGEFIPKPK